MGGQDNPISISFRNNILDQCNDVYEKAVRYSVSPSLRATAVMGGGLLEKSNTATTPTKTAKYVSPYAKNLSVSPAGGWNAR